MSVEKMQDEGQTLRYPKGKILGVVDTRAVSDSLAQALERAGLGNLEVIAGEEGAQLLERVNTFFLSELEDRTLSWHIEQVKAGHLVVGIVTSSDRVDEVVRMASQHGARGLTYFGWGTVTWLTK